MGESKRLSDGSYIDSEGIYDVTQGETQEAINAALTKKLSHIYFHYNADIRIGPMNGALQIATDAHNGNAGDMYGVDFFFSQKRISLWFYDASKNTYTTVWQFT